jgi:ADP-ribose pyrophosphatase
MTEPEGSAGAPPGPEGEVEPALPADPPSTLPADAASPLAIGAPAPAAGLDDDRLTERLVESRVLHKGRYLEFRLDTVERADGSRAERDVVWHPGAVAILAIDAADRVLLVRQFRLPAGGILLEIPAGTLDVDPETGAIEDPDEAARRELEEETSYRAGSWRRLASFWTAPGFASELMHLYLATDLEPADADRLGPEEDERLELVRLPFADAVAAAERGEIADAKSIVGLLWMDRLTLGEPTAGPAVPGAAAAGETAGAAAGAAAFLAEPELVIQFRPTMLETLDATMIATRRPIGAKLFGVLGLALGLVALFYGLVFEAIVLLVLGGGLATGALSVPFVALTVRRRPDLMLAPTTVRFGRDGVDYESPRGHSQLRWDVYRRIRESSRFFFLETGVNVFLLPKRAFDPEGLTTFRRIAAEAGFGPDGRRTVSRGAPPGT